MQNWDMVRAFLALHRSGEYEGAAQMLGIDHSTLRRRVHRLEQEMGGPLFIGLDGTYSVHPKASSMLDAALQMELAAHSFFTGPPDEASGEVRATMIDVAAHWLAPDLAQFSARCPGINLTVTTEARFVDLERDMIDIAVRMARPTRGNERIKRLATVHYGIYASPVYLADHAGSGAPHRLIMFAAHFLRDYHEFLESEEEWMLQLLPKGQVVCHTDSYLQMREYCAAGMGLALLPELLANERNDLVCVSPRVADCNLYLVANRNTNESCRVRQLIDFLSQVFREKLGSRVIATTV